MNRQRNHRSPRILEVEALTREDLAFLQQKSHVPSLQRIREQHRMIARLLAMGLTQTEVANRLNYSITRISILARDPMIQELIAQLRKRIDDNTVDQIDEVMEQLKTQAIMAGRQINQRLEDAEDGKETLTVRELTSIYELSLDRVGYGKKSTTVNVNYDFAARLEAARARSRSVPVIDVKAVSEVKS